MRSKFFIYLLIVLIGCAVGYFLWQVVRSLYNSAMDVKTGRDLDRLAGEYRQKRAEQQRDAAARLDNGCAHDFNDDGGAYPPDVCRSCGFAKTRPPGDCDHQWQRLPGIVPHSKCAKCGAEYSSVSRV